MLEGKGTSSKHWRYELLCMHPYTAHAHSLFFNFYKCLLWMVIKLVKLLKSSNNSHSLHMVCTRFTHAMCAHLPSWTSSRLPVLSSFPDTFGNKPLVLFLKLNWTPAKCFSWSISTDQTLCSWKRIGACSSLQKGNSTSCQSSLCPVVWAAAAASGPHLWPVTKSYRFPMDSPKGPKTYSVLPPLNSKAW